jgi:hypothetical protein
MVRDFEKLKNVLRSFDHFRGSDGNWGIRLLGSKVITYCISYDCRWAMEPD